MNRKRNIAIVSALGIAALILTTGWNVLAGSAWPPESMTVYSVAGTWFHTGEGEPADEIDTVTISPEDPRTGKGFIIHTDVNPDFTAGGEMAEADSWTPWYGTYVRTGPSTWQVKSVCYVKNDTKPKPTVLLILITEGTWTMTATDAIESVGTLSIYSPDQDQDGDGLPDEGQLPLMETPIAGYMKPL
jgi:hypothetical protein